MRAPENGLRTIDIGVPVPSSSSYWKCDRIGGTMPVHRVI